MTTLARHAALTAPMTDALVEPVGLLDRLRQGDAAALAQVARHYSDRLARVAYLHLSDAHAAEDVTQEALIAAWDAAARTRQVTPLWPWLLGILFNRCRTHLRGLSRRRRRERAAHELRLSHVETETAVDDRVEHVRHALAGLSEPLRCVVILRFEQSLSVADTAAALGVPEGTVKRRCHDALNQLRDALRATP